jgi:metal-responsive CopG/Arc/MetJ family transcriptional regulator
MRKRVHILVTEAQHEAVLRLVKETGLGRSEILRRAIDQFLKEHDRSRRGLAKRSLAQRGLA